MLRIFITFSRGKIDFPRRGLTECPLEKIQCKDRGLRAREGFFNRRKTVGKSMVDL